MSEEKKEITLNIGIDFGGVLSSQDANINGNEHRNTSIDMPGALQVLQYLKDKGHRLFLISFCGKSRATETAETINKTVPGLFNQLFFVKSKEYKKYICKHANIDIMIDDTFDILLDIHSNVRDIHLLHFSKDEVSTTLDNIHNVFHWKGVKEKCEDILKLKCKEQNVSKYIYNV